MDTNALNQVLTWLFGGGGAMVATYWLMEQVPELANLQPNYKRYASLGIAALLSCLAYVFAVGLSYVDKPATPQGWLESLFAVAFLAIGGSQWLHGKRKLAGR